MKETDKKFWKEWVTIAVKRATKDKLKELMLRKGMYNYNEVIEYLLEVNEDAYINNNE